ncbi:zinc ribbon domain-containing protein [Pirellulaceae bacterium SH449]
MKVTDSIIRQLHARLKQIADMEGQIARAPKLIEVARSKVQSATVDLANCRETIKKKRMEADRRQLQQKEREAKLLDYNGKMNAAKNNREYQSFKEQIAADTQANSVLSDEIFETLEEIDALQALSIQLDEKLQLTTAECEKNVGQIEARLNVVQEDLVLAKSQLATSLSELPNDFVNEFQRLVSSRNADAFAEMDGESCGGCYNALPPRVRDTLRQGQPILCPSCGRLLYRPD